MDGLRVLTLLNMCERGSLRQCFLSAYLLCHVFVFVCVGDVVTTGQSERGWRWKLFFFILAALEVWYQERGPEKSHSCRFLMYLTRISYMYLWFFSFSLRFSASRLSETIRAMGRGSLKNKKTDHIRDVRLLFGFRLSGWIFGQAHRSLSRLKLTSRKRAVIWHTKVSETHYKCVCFPQPPALRRPI